MSDEITTSEVEVPEAEADAEHETAEAVEAVEAPRQKPPAVAPKPLVDARRAQDEAAVAQPSKSKMMRGFHERRKLQADTEVVGLDPRQRRLGDGVYQAVELGEPVHAGEQPVTGGYVPEGS